MSKIGTTANTITLNYLPQNLVINSASSGSGIPFVDLTQLNVSVNGTEIVSMASNATIETAFSVNNQVGGKIDPTATTAQALPKQTVLQLADGKIENVNCNLTFTSATDYDVYANSETLGTENYFWSTSTINALSNNIYSDFRSLSFPEDDGELIIQWKNGYSDKFVLDDGREAIALSSKYMSQVNLPYQAYVSIFNPDDSIASVQYFNNNATNAQTAVVQR
tara:strand:- start:1043 stop:1708 length:666 start_codon:yes stop_codon:yes gene_type:complete